MSIEGIIVGLLAIVIGAAWAFYGLKLFTILLPIWAFLFGLVSGAAWGQEVFGESSSRLSCRGASASSSGSSSRRSRTSGTTPRSSSSPARWAIRWVSASSSTSVSGRGVVAFLVGLILGAVFAIGAFLLGVPVLLVMIFSAFSGAAAVVNGVFVALGQIRVESVDVGMFGSLLHQGPVGIDRVHRHRRRGTVLPVA